MESLPLSSLAHNVNGECPLPPIASKKHAFVQKRKERNQPSSTLTDYPCISVALCHHSTQVLGHWRQIGNKNIKTTALCDESSMNSRTRVLCSCSLCVNKKAKIDAAPMVPKVIQIET